MKQNESKNTNDKRHSDAMLEWGYTEGPPLRPWQWYVTVLAVGLGIGAIIYLPYRDTFVPLLSMLFWVAMVVAVSLTPSREYAARLNRQLLEVRDVKRGRLTIERNLNEFATWKIIEYPEDRLNNLSRKLIFRRRDGKGTIEIALTGEDERDELILARVAEVVPPAPEITPTLWERFDYIAQRWIGWR